MVGTLLVAALAAAVGRNAVAQPTNVRAWYAQGQVFVVWERPAPPVNPTDTVEIYASAAAQISIANMTRVGKMFFPEYTGARLKALGPAATLRVPTPAGGTYQLLANEGAFAFTPRAAGNLFFAVVDTGSNVVNAGNSSSAVFGYDPVNEPVRPHQQFTGFTQGGNQYAAYVVWIEGRNDVDNARPDIPVLGDADKNGVPQVFAVTQPVGGLTAPAGTRSCLLAHAGENEYQLFLPGVPGRSNLSLGLLDGVVITPDDSYYANVEGVMELANTAWFGYSTATDPFSSLARAEPPAGSVVVNFTQRRVHWILDWALSARSGLGIDPQRVAAIGHSGGGRGASHITRLRPERFAAVVVHTPGSDLLVEDPLKANFLQGNYSTNLATNLTDMNGNPLGVTDVFTMTTRLSATTRDFPLTRFFYGKRDQNDAAAWSASQRAIVDGLENAQAGFMISWDEREHGVDKWDNETDDASDGNVGPWPDIAQWIAPVKTRRASGDYLVTQYRSNQSYPGFFNSDQDATLTGRQPDPGNGDPNLGDAWGTWGGYFDWDTATIVDQPTLWACTVFAAATQQPSVDNAPVVEYYSDLAPRKTNAFAPANGTKVYWYTLPTNGQFVEQQGEVFADADKVVKVSGVRVPRQDVTTNRVFLSTVPLCLGSVEITGPSPASICPRGDVSFRVEVRGSGPLVYRWRKDGVPIDSSIFGNPTAATDTLTLVAPRRNAEGVYDCVVTNACGDLESTAVDLSLCVADLNCDGVVDDLDFQVFASAYNILLCGDPAMPPKCLADLNGDGFVDDADFPIFARAYDGVFCP
jgi:pimeloyl-ACP methyl ester carboxylesterase